MFENMISVQSIHGDIRSQLKKNNSYFLSPEDIDIAINKAQNDIMEVLIRDYETGMSSTSFEQNMLKLHSFAGLDTVRDLPSDVFKVSTVFILDREGDILNDRHFNDRINSSIIGPSSLRPIATIYVDGTTPKIRILPASDGHKIKYFKVPVQAKFNYTNTNNIPVYNPTGSIDLEFPFSEYNKILNRALKYLGMPSANAEALTLENNI